MICIVSAYCCVGNGVVGSTYYVLAELVQENHRCFAAKASTNDKNALNIVWQLTLKTKARNACE